MTDEHSGMNHPEEPMHTPGDMTPPAAPTPAEAAMSKMSDAFSSSEGMVSLAGALLVAVYILTGLIMNDYWISWLPLLLAILALILPRINRDFVEKLAPLPVLMKTLGYLIVILGVIALVEDLRFSSSTFDEFGGILGALVSYGAYALAFLGARGIKT